MKKSFNIQELLHHKSKHHETKPMHSSLRAFQRHQEHNLKHPRCHKYKQNNTKQTNKLPSFIQLVDIRFTTPTSLDIPHVDCCNSPNKRSNTLQASSCASSSLKPKTYKNKNKNK